MSSGAMQFLVFLLLNAAVGVMTWLHCRKADRGTNETREYCLAPTATSAAWVYLAAGRLRTVLHRDGPCLWPAQCARVLGARPSILRS